MFKVEEEECWNPRVKWWNLTKDSAMKLSDRIMEEGAWKRATDADTMWEVMTKCIQRSAKESLGTSRRGGNKMKGAWWWKEEVKEKVKKKKEAYAAFMNSGTDEEKEISRVRCKATKKIAKKAVVIAKSIAYDRLYQKLRTKEGEKEVFRLARDRERRTRDLDVVRCIKNKNGEVLSEDAEIKEI